MFGMRLVDVEVGRARKIDDQGEVPVAVSLIEVPAQVQRPDLRNYRRQRAEPLRQGIEGRRPLRRVLRNELPGDDVSNHAVAS